MSRDIKHGATDQSTVLRFVDITTGEPETGIAYNSAGIALWYRLEGGAKVAITPADLAALTTAHADGGFKHISDGLCRLDLPDAACASSAGVLVGGSATGMVAIPAYHPLVANIGGELSTTERAAIADNVLRRAYASARASSNGEAVSQESLLGALAKLTCDGSGISGSDFVAKHSDGTSFYTQPLTFDGDQLPIKQIG